MNEMQIFIRILTPILISLSIGIMFLNIYKRNSKSVTENLRKDHIIIKFPIMFFWVGFLGSSVFVAAIVLMTLFPNDQHLYGHI